MADSEITARDRTLLRFAAEHRIFLPDHVRALLRVSARVATERLAALGDAGLIAGREVFADQPPLYRITGEGLATVGSSLAPPRINRKCYEHDVGLGWLWLAARDGAFGPVAEVIGERRMRSADARREAGSGEPAVAVRCGGVGPGGRERLHYPDLLLVDPQGRRVALELELSGKGQRRREGILRAYGADPRIDAVVYMVTDPALGRSIAASAARAGVEDLVYVQLARLSVTALARDDAPVRRRIPERRPPLSERALVR